MSMWPPWAVWRPVTKLHFLSHACPNWLSDVALFLPFMPHSVVVYMLLEARQCLLAQARDFCFLHHERIEVSSMADIVILVMQRGPSSLERSTSCQTGLMPLI